MQEERVVMQLLNIQAHLNHIQLAAMFMSSEVEYDALLPEFTAIVELSEAAHPYLSSFHVARSQYGIAAGGLFRFERGIVFPLLSNPYACGQIRDFREHYLPEYVLGVETCLRYPEIFIDSPSPRLFISNY